MIKEPPLSGVDHLMTTFKSLIVVMGATGLAGTYAAKIVTSEENWPNPTLFRA
jgi:hypothetical protein